MLKYLRLSKRIKRICKWRNKLLPIKQKSNKELPYNLSFHLGTKPQTNKWISIPNNKLNSRVFILGRNLRSILIIQGKTTYFPPQVSLYHRPNDFNLKNKNPSLGLFFRIYLALLIVLLTRLWTNKKSV